MKSKIVKVRVKSAKPQIYQQFTKTIYSLACPYCHLLMVGGYYMDKSTLVYACSRCGQPIWLEKED